MLPLRHCLNTQWHYANKFSTYVVLQVEIILQGWQSGHLHGHLCCWFPCQHATPLIRLSIGPPVPVIHGADIVGSVSGNGHSRLCFIILVYVQDFCFSQGRLDIKQQSWDRTSVSDMLRECARTKLQLPFLPWQDSATRLQDAYTGLHCSVECLNSDPHT